MLALLLLFLSSEDDLPILLEAPLENELLPDVNDEDFWPAYWKHRQPGEQQQLELLEKQLKQGALTEERTKENTAQKGTLMFTGECPQPTCVGGPRNVTLSWETSSYGGGIALQIDLFGSDAWLGIGVSSDGNMVGGGRYFGRLGWKYITTPAVVAVWEAGLLRPLRYNLQGYSEAEVNLMTEGYLVNVYQDGFPYVPYGGAVAARTERKTTLQLVLPYTHDCQLGRLAVCIDGPTHFILAHGNDDSWRRHPSHGMFAVSRLPHVVLPIRSLRAPISSSRACTGPPSTSQAPFTPSSRSHTLLLSAAR